MWRIYRKNHVWRHLLPWRRHGLVLVVAGLVYVGIGLSYMITTASPLRNATLEFAIAWWPLEVWGLIFVITGIIAIISSRWPPVAITWGYTVLTGLATIWACFYILGILFGDGRAQSISGVLVWTLVAFLWWAISGLVNPEDGRTDPWKVESGS